MTGWVACLLFWFALLALTLIPARRPSPEWLVCVGLYGALLSIVLWTVPPDSGPPSVWPLFSTACLTIAVGLAWAIFRNNSRGKNDPRREQRPSLPGADARRLWREKRRRTSTDVQAQRHPPSDIKSQT
jgi:hypothetical protein